MDTVMVEFISGRLRKRKDTKGAGKSIEKWRGKTNSRSARRGDCSSKNHFNDWVMITGKWQVHIEESFAFFISHTHTSVTAASFSSNLILLLLPTPPPFVTRCVSRHQRANDWKKSRTDNRWYCLMMCYSFFSYHYQLFSSSRLDVGMFVSVTHQSLLDPQILLAMSAGCGYHSRCFSFMEKQKQTMHTTRHRLCRLDFDQKAIGHDTIKAKERFTIMFKHEWSSDKIVFISSSSSSSDLFDLRFRHLDTTETTCFTEHKRVKGKAIVH